MKSENNSLSRLTTIMSGIQLSYAHKRKQTHHTKEKNFYKKACYLYSFAVALFT